MKKIFLVFSLAAFAGATSCVSPSGDLPSPESAVVITAQNEKEGVAKEIAWIQENHPGGKILRFVTRPSKENKVYDFFWIQLTDGSRKIVLFEISSFYRKT